MKCDFCGANNPVWDYPCIDFTAGRLIMGPTDHAVKDYEELLNSTSSWLACERCAEYIESYKWTELAVLLAPRPGVRLPMEMLWKGFHEFRTGPRKRIS